MLKKFLTDQRFIRKRNTTFKIGTLMYNLFYIFGKIFIKYNNSQKNGMKLLKTDFVLWMPLRPLRPVALWVTSNSSPCNISDPLG